MLKNIVIEDDLENYHYIKEQIENVATLFPEFNSLKDEIELITEYLEIEKSRKKIAKANFVLSNILENIPLIPITDNQEIEFFLVTQNNNLFLTPYIFNRDEIERYNLDLVTDDNFSQEYDIPPLPQASDTVRIPVLMYHHIDFFPTGSSSFKQSLYVTEEIFEKQIAYLTRKNYKSISTEEFYSFLITGKNPTQKIVMITFDDSLLTHYTKAFSILQKYGHKGVFFVPSKVGLITGEKLKEMSENEMDIQSHSATHPNLSLISNRAILHQEIVESKKFLENITNKPVTSFAYPGCVGNIPTFNMVQNSGYTQGFSCGTGIDHEYAKRFILSRRQVLNDMEQFKRILSGY